MTVGSERSLAAQRRPAETGKAETEEKQRSTRTVLMTVVRRSPTSRISPGDRVGQQPAASAKMGRPEGSVSRDAVLANRNSQSVVNRRLTHGPYASPPATGNRPAAQKALKQGWHRQGIG
jgi:hypothetical protein